VAESIFTAQTPLAGNVNDGTQYTLGTVWTPAVDGTVTHIRVYAPTGTPAAAFVGVLYTITGEAAGTELARATFGALTPAAWNTVPLPAPVPVTAGNHYVACYITADLFVLTTFFFTDAGVTNGDLTAIQSGVPYGNGRLHAGDGFPEVASGQQSCYFADVVFEAGAAPVAAEGTGLGGGTGRAAGTKAAPAAGAVCGAAAGHGAGQKAAPGTAGGNAAAYATVQSLKRTPAAGSAHSAAVAAAAGVKVVQSGGVLYGAGYGLSGAAGPTARGPIVVTTSAHPTAAVDTRTTTVTVEVSAR